MAIFATVLFWVKKAFRLIKTAIKALNIVSGIKCTFEWIAWLTLIKGFWDMLKNMAFPEEAIVAALGIDKIIKARNSGAIKEKIEKSLSETIPVINKTKEFTARLDLPPSPWNGVHKPPYHSSVVQEVLYEFSNVAGTGTMIIMFNPEGFNDRPKAPMIIRYVDEAEFAEFIHSPSWGEYWRWNYILRNRKRNKFRVKPDQPAGLIDESEYPMPKAEPLDEYIVNALDLPDGSNDLIIDEFRELILKGMDKSISQTEMMKRAIENGQIGRGLEEGGLRVTSLLSETLRDVPANLKNIITKNPIFKDVAKVTSQYKVTLNKWRGVRDMLSSAKYQRVLTKDAALLSGMLGELGAFQSALVTMSDGALGLGIDGSIKMITEESIRAGGISYKIKMERGMRAREIADATIKKKYDVAYGKGKQRTYEKYLRQREADARRAKAKNPDYVQGKPQTREEWERNYYKEGGKQDIWKKGQEKEALALAKQEIGGWKYILKEYGTGSLKMLVPPDCIPFTGKSGFGIGIIGSIF